MTQRLDEIAERVPEHHPTFRWYWNCPFCKDSGFDLRGLAHHVWMQCEAVEHLAKENIENIRAWHERNFARLKETNDGRE